ncbi:hypothetical protein O181_019743 [Austropuccinia psidii MF-1]|uniref:Integrase catalytic domain-containing protein n=1 Tax=Austropuccinia psidii MF-1 TaxID=1389203 RepID=A0A9Q3CBL9_9BASI|nr:hypothetical protein [Austropuccinia psidii MF-1]
MDCVTALPPSGYKIYEAFLVIVERYSKTPIFLTCHKNDTAMDTPLLLCNIVISPTGLLKDIISERGPKFMSTIWTNLHIFIRTKLSFATEYHPQSDGLEDRIIQYLEDIIRGLCLWFGID